MSDSGLLSNDELDNDKSNNEQADCIFIREEKNTNEDSIIIIDDETETANKDVNLEFYEDKSSSNIFTTPSYTAIGNLEKPANNLDTIEIIDEDESMDDISEQKCNENTSENDSIIFVSEDPPPRNNAAPKYVNMVTRFQKAQRNQSCSMIFKNPFDPIVTSIPKANYNSNLYNPQKRKRLKPGKRMVIIDGCNVAFAHAHNGEFSAKGLKICIEYFEKMGHEVKAVLPLFRSNNLKTREVLAPFLKTGKIILTPCKNLPGLSTTSYEDRFVLQLALETDGVVISNDNYRDLITESFEIGQLIKSRVVGFSWCNDMFILPKDPYGRNGPLLDDILNRK